MMNWKDMEGSNQSMFQDAPPACGSKDWEKNEEYL